VEVVDAVFAEYSSMKIVVPSLVVEEMDAFTNDCLDRKKYGEDLRNLVLQTDDELVIALSGQWGEGKTTFVKMWRGLLAESKIPSIYIDAFANDYIDDAFISVASAITGFVSENIEKDSAEKLSDLKEKTKKIGTQFLAWSAKIGIKAATLGIIRDSDIEELKDIKTDLSKDMSSLIGEFIEERLESHTKDVELIQSFRELLSEIPSKLVGNEGNSLVVIIDELDRCKPTFAVELLEKIKHLFSVKNVIFVLVMNKNQLEESIKNVYGQNVDAHTYLQKFISFEVQLPKYSRWSDSTDLSKYSRKLFTYYGLESWSGATEFINSLDALSSHFDLSLRQLEKVVTNLLFMRATSSGDQLSLPSIMVFLAVIKVFRPTLFEKLINQDISCEEVFSELNFGDIGEVSESSSQLKYTLELLRDCLLPKQKVEGHPCQQSIQSLENHLAMYHIPRSSVIPFFARKISIFVPR
jgi:hypothetical protein